MDPMALDRFDRAELRLPALVGTNDIFRAVGIPYNQLGNECVPRYVRFLYRFWRITIAAELAGSKPDSDSILLLLHQTRHIKCVVKHPLGIVTQLRPHDLIAEGFPIEAGLVYALTADV